MFAAGERGGVHRSKIRQSVTSQLHGYHRHGTTDELLLNEHDELLEIEEHDDEELVEKLHDDEELDDCDEQEELEDDWLDSDEHDDD